MIDKEAQELDSLFDQWKKNKDTHNFQNLYKAMKPDIETAALKASYGSNLPQSAHKIFAAQAFLNALETYDPKHGANLKTHVYGSVQNKTKRFNYMYQDLGYKPEPRAMQVGKYQAEFENLRLSLGREPTNNEIAQQLNWSVKDVNLIQKEVVKDYSLSDSIGEHGVVEGSKSEEILSYLYFELDQEEKLVYDYVFGRNGKPKMVKANKRVDFERIARVVGFSAPKVRMIWNRVAAKLKKHLEK